MMPIAPFACFYNGKVGRVAGILVSFQKLKECVLGVYKVFSGVVSVYFVVQSGELFKVG